MNTEKSLEEARFNMIEQQIRPWNVLDARVLELLHVVKREDFVPPAHRSLAFVDMELPLPKGQCMMAPKAEARLLQELAVKPHERVLEIGAGSGYMAALLAKQAAQVVSLELHGELVDMAKESLRKAGISNVEVRQGDAAKGLEALGKFDVILISGSLAKVPQHLLDLLQPKGRLAAIVGDEPIMTAQVLTRTGDQQFESRTPWDYVAPRMQHFPETSAFSF